MTNRNCVELANSSQEIEREFILAALVKQLDEWTTKIKEVQIQCKRKERYIPPNKLRKSEDNGNNFFKDTLQIVLWKSLRKIEGWKKWGRIF